jgi:outer membrane protein TolC
VSCSDQKALRDARLQQALVQYRETVIQAAREVEDAMVAFVGSQQQDDILVETVESARRSTEIAMLRYQEGFADYQRVLDAQQALFAQAQRYVSNKALAVQSLIAVYKALGGGWQAGPQDFVDEATRQQMEQRSDWDNLLESDRETISGQE